MGSRERTNSKHIKVRGNGIREITKQSYGILSEKANFLM